MKSLLLIFLVLTTAALAQIPREDQLTQALSLIQQIDESNNGVFGFAGKEINGIQVMDVDHAFGDMRFNLENRKIEVFNSAFTRGIEIMAVQLVHEIRHATFPTHVDCAANGPLRGMPACDETLPAWSAWQSGGSYVYELAFQKLAIDAKLPGHERYVRQFIGNLHIRFTQRPSLEVIDQWLGAELLRDQAAFIAQVRAAYYR